ncbi:hypothetical protein [Thalassobium sp. R2A62]|uniref:hypothetical protein n=1 Tax=Thalassobium sp. R2A62 TaxID=633131 RepID=UPI0001B1CF23|nr:hypothetical protein [Thalassobium sp. R2A62]EET46662.1 hypothetical protein TR2A62_3183 [Thalassobium sp. R2A62]
MLTRRHLLQSSAALMILPYAARAAGHSGDTFASATGEVSVFCHVDSECNSGVAVWTPIL